ncbi:uncharacterized protein BDV14DRAFT_198944 [Aspergillus stella-maris]|uniref:uncharacterized protein n=1 Tax=Aspergillus stella-maris TaxID=1810926 RepID=UPI003CCD842C
MQNLSNRGRYVWQKPEPHMALALVTPTTHEEAVQKVWEVVTRSYFPDDESYRTRTKSASQSNNTTPDIKIFKVTARHPDSHWRKPTEWEERQILMIECKRPSRDTLLGWDDTIMGQFFDDLEATLNASGRLFGAVAIGTKIRFYRYDGQLIPADPNILVPLHLGILDIREDADYPEIAHWMDYIKLYGYQWAY